MSAYVTCMSHTAVSPCGRFVASSVSGFYRDGPDSNF